MRASSRKPRGSTPLQEGRKYVIRHTTRSARTVGKGLQYRLDINTLHREVDTDRLTLNDIGRVQLRTTLPLMVDDYSINRSTGGFVLIDEPTNRTVRAGMITHAR